MVHKNFGIHKTLGVHSARCTQYIHVGSHLLKLLKTYIPVKYSTTPPPHPKQYNYT